MWADLERALPRLASAVLTIRDADGYPFSIRCRPEPDRSSRSFRVELPANVPIRPGPAGLLWHVHDDHLWNQVSYTTRGRLERTSTGWRYTPTHYTPGLGIGGPVAFARFLLGARRRTAAYLARRGLARPQVPWREIDAIKTRALAGRGPGEPAEAGP